MRKDLDERKDEILAWIDEHRPNAYIARELYCKVDTLKSWYKRNNIEYNGNIGGKGWKTSNRKKPLEEYIKSNFQDSAVVKRKLIEEGYKEYKCEICGVEGVWMGKKLPLELHHKDGNHFNSSIDNLQLLCPNCHAIQEGNSDANMGRYTLKELKKEDGRVVHNRNFREARIKKILNSNIDFSKWGWGTELSKVLGISPQKSIKWVKTYMADFYEKECHKPKNN